MNLHEFANALRAHADEIDDMVKSLVVPTQERFSITDAFAKLRMTCGPNINITVHPPEVVSSSADSPLKAEPWRVNIGRPAGRYDSIGYSYGITLADAVAKAIAAYQAAMNPKAGKPDAAQAIEQITEAFSDPLPL